MARQNSRGGSKAGVAINEQLAASSGANEPPSGGLLAPLAEDLEHARVFIEHAQAANTRRAYRAQVRRYVAWAEARGLTHLPASPQTVGLYLAHLGGDGAAPASIDVVIAAIVDLHARAGHALDRRAPPIATVRRGLRRKLGVAQVGAAPLLVAQLRRLVDSLGTATIDVRDRALLLVGFAGGFRRSELVGLEADDVRVTAAGIEATLRRSKTDQEGAGRIIAIPRGHGATCPAQALEAWLAVRGREAGPLFVGITRWGRLTRKPLDGKEVSRRLRERARRAGISLEGLSAHSLRVGLVTEASRAGKSIAAIQRTTGHKSVEMVARYIRAADQWEDNAADGIGL